MGYPQLSIAADTSLGRDAIQRDLEWLENETQVDLIRFNKDKCKIFHLNWGNPRYKHSLGELFESSPAEKDFRILVN